MPKTIDYASRFEFLRLAAFQVVRDDGPESVSLRRLAAELGCPLGTVRRLLDADSSLVALAADAVTSRWRSTVRRRRSPGRDAPALDRAVHLVSSLLPLRPTDVAEHLAWFKLMGSRTSVVERASLTDGEPPLSVQFRIAERGWAELGWAELGWADEPATAVDRPADGALESRAQAHEETESEVLRAALALTSNGDDELSHLRALVHGLAWDVCLGHLSTEEGAAVVRNHLTRLAA